MCININILGKINASGLSFIIKFKIYIYIYKNDKIKWPHLSLSTIVNDN